MSKQALRRNLITAVALTLAALIHTRAEAADAAAGDDAIARKRNETARVDKAAEDSSNAINKAEAASTKVDTATAELNATKSDLATAKNDIASTKASVDQLRANKLLTSGLTGGVALAVQFLGPNTDNIKQTTAKAVAMPYILAFPGYWGTSHTTRAACASSWTSASESEADAAAMTIATERAERIFGAVEFAVTANKTANEAAVKEELGLDYPSNKLEDPNTIIVTLAKTYVQQKAEADASKDDAKIADAAAFRDRIIGWMARMQWKASRSAWCWPRRLGLWVGLPLSYDTNTKVDGETDPVSRTIKPVIAFGGAFSPNQYISLLAGVTAATASVAGASGGAAADHTIWATTIALGGNLDIVTSLAK